MFGSSRVENNDMFLESEFASSSDFCRSSTNCACCVEDAVKKVFASLSVLGRSFRTSPSFMFRHFVTLLEMTSLCSWMSRCPHARRRLVMVGGVLGVSDAASRMCAILELVYGSSWRIQDDLVSQSSAVDASLTGPSSPVSSEVTSAFDRFANSVPGGLPVPADLVPIVRLADLPCNVVLFGAGGEELLLLFIGFVIYR